MRRPVGHLSVPCLFAGGALLLAVCRAAGPAGSADDYWPAWRGPRGDGSSPRATPPLNWSETNQVKWKVRVPGRGAATPVVWGERVFVQTAIPTGRKGAPTADVAVPTPAAPRSGPAEGAPPPPPGGRGGRGGNPMGSEKPTEFQQFAVLCLERQTGKVLWQKTACEVIPHEGHQRDHGFASHSPVTDGTRLFAYFGSRGLYCYDLEGNLKWQRDLGRMQVKMGFGEGSSPALAGGFLIVNWDHEGDDFIVAFDPETGRERWRQPRQEGTSWATPLILADAATPQVITSATGKVRSYDLARGSLLWECGGMTQNAIPSPVAADGLVYLTSGFRGAALLAIRLGKTGDLTGTEAVAWHYERNTPYVPSPLLHQGRLYFFANNNGILSCLDAKTGKVLIDAERVEALQGVYASPVGAGGRVYLLGRNGVTVVIESGDTLRSLATNRLEEQFDASPALAGGDLFLRGHEYLYCLAQRQ